MARFQKGKSGNPNGRPPKSKAQHEAEEAIRKLAPDAVQKLSELMNSDNESVRLKACQIILDRVYGKPKQAIETADTYPILVEVVDFSNTSIQASSSH